MLLFNGIYGGAQEKKENSELVKTLLLNGFTVQADIASIVSSILSKGETYSTEGSVQLDIKHKYYPIVEVGFGGANKLSVDNIDFKTNGLFGRFGVDINLLKQKKDAKASNNLFLAGARIGVSNLRYDITNISITDNYWGGAEILNFNDRPATKVWFEIVAGVRVEVFRNVFMGWTIRNKNLLNQDKEGEISSWYIPGFGINSSSTWGFNYTLGYRFNTSIKKIKENNQL
ncbi:MAG: hypothetical protein GZ091_06715 [Paludibacter sp.]|nr:hypothetical protein [Paludibacter sp.]